MATAPRPRPSQYSRTASSSASVSAVKRLIPTTAGTPKRAMLSRWRPRFSSPARTASTFSAPRSPIATPPCILRARMVATTTAASGRKPAFRHLMSKNFSAPRSAPNPASVTT